MDIYHYHPITGEYLGADVADHDPLILGMFLLPAWSTPVAPPAAGSNEVAVYNGSVWSIVDDYRGVVWNVQTGNSSEWRQFGPLPTEWTAVPPPNNYSLWTGQGWVTDWDALKRIKRDELKLAVSVAVVAGIDCDILGAVHHYPTTAVDQQNLSGLVIESLLSGAGDEYHFWCADELGVWARRVHSLSQIQSLGKVVAGHIKAQQSHYEQKLIELSSANTEAEISLVVW